MTRYYKKCEACDGQGSIETYARTEIGTSFFIRSNCLECKNGYVDCTDEIEPLKAQLTECQAFIQQIVDYDNSGVYAGNRYEVMWRRWKNEGRHLLHLQGKTQSKKVGDNGT